MRLIDADDFRSWLLKQKRLSKNYTVAALDEMPTIEPDPKKGEWIKQNPTVDTEECSECGYNIIDEEFETLFCPWCGAEMRGEQNE